MGDGLRVPYTQQFAPDQTPLRKLLPVIRQHAGNRSKLKKAIAAAFFKKTKTPPKIAGNTLISLKGYGVIDAKGALTPFGNTLTGLRGAEAHRALARHILLDLDGVPILETLREMKSAGQKLALSTIPGELRKRGFKVSDNSSDLSGMLGWLRQAGIVRDYEVNEAEFEALLGTKVEHVGDLKKLSPEQLYFLRAAAALGVEDFTPHNNIVDHAEALYPGQVRFNRKELDRTVLKPLQSLGYIEVRKRAKSVAGARGGKPAEVRPTTKLKTEFRDRLLAAFARAAGYADLREISSKAWSDVVAQVKQTKDQASRAKGLELLAIKICQTLDLDFMGWRETDEEITAGGEVDAMLHSSRLVYSRWQVQCKASAKISYEALAKEIGASHVTLANVILLVGTGNASPAANRLREHIVRTTNLNIIILEGHHLDRIVVSPTEIVRILNEQAREALRTKGAPPDLAPPPSSDGPKKAS